MRSLTFPRTISIHALREEGDFSFCRSSIPLFYFYPRPPRGGRRVRDAPDHMVLLFLSTPSARRATLPYFIGLLLFRISIHALREEGDLAAAAILIFVEFLSTPSARRATPQRLLQGVVLVISIHALREEGDALPRWYVFVRSNFYPRPPRGGRPMTIGQRVKIRRISIHALREEGDCEANNLSYVFIKFLSTPSARRATRPRFLIITTHRYFYPRPPRGGRRPVHGGSQLR